MHPPSRRKCAGRAQTRTTRPVRPDTAPRSAAGCRHRLSTLTDVTVRIGSARGVCSPEHSDEESHRRDDHGDEWRRTLDEQVESTEIREGGRTPLATEEHCRGEKCDQHRPQEGIVRDSKTEGLDTKSASTDLNARDDQRGQADGQEGSAKRVG